MLKSRQELIQAITAEFDQARIGWLSYPYFELYEFVDKGFKVPDIPVFEIHISRKKTLLNIIIWSALGLVYGYFYLKNFETIPSFMGGVFLFFGLAIYFSSEYLRKPLVLLLDSNVMTIDNKLILPWEDILTVHFLGRLRYSQQKLIVHYLDDYGQVQTKRVGIDYLEYKPKEIAAIIQSFINKTKST